MKVWYNVVKSKELDIDFNFIYESIWAEEYNEDPEIPTYDIYLEFIDNLEYWIQHLCNSDFIEYDNDFASEQITEAWGNWLEEKFGENWDEV